MHTLLRSGILLGIFAAALAACGGGGGGTVLPGPAATATPTPIPSSGGTPTPIPLGSPTTSYSVAQISPANGFPAYISDPLYLQFSQQPDVTFDSSGNPQGTTVNAISVTPISGGAPTPLPVRFIYDANAPQLGPDVVGIKFYAVAGAKYRVSIASSATSQSGTPYGGISQFIAALPTTPPLPAAVAPQSPAYFYGLNPGGVNSQVAGWLGTLKPKIVRVGIDMSATEPASGSFSFGALDTLLQQANQLGVAVDLLLVQYNAPGWAYDPNDTATPPPPSGPSGFIACTPQIFAGWVQGVVKHVSDPSQHVNYTYPPPAAIELGNEPDTPSFWVVDKSNNACAANAFTTVSDARPYIPYLQQAYSAVANVKSAQTTFLNAGVATNAGDESYFSDLVRNAAGSEDAWAIHVYAWADPNALNATRTWEAFNVLTDDMAVAGPSKNFWVTEGAFTSNPYCPDGVDPQTQAYFLTEDYNKMASLSAPSVASFMYFELQDNSAPSAPSGGQDPCFEPGGTGLVDSSGTLRPAFNAFESLVSGI